MNTKSKAVEAFAEQANLLRDYLRAPQSVMNTAQRCSKIAARLSFEPEADDVFAAKLREQTARMRSVIRRVGWQEILEGALQVERSLIQLREKHGDQR